MNRSVKAQMKYANKIGAEYVIVLGDDEINSGQANIKNMETGEQIPVALSGLTDYFLGMEKTKCKKDSKD